MRILFLADANSSHTLKLVYGLAQKGFVIGIFTLSKPNTDWLTLHGIQVFDKDAVSAELFHASNLQKLAYLRKRRAVKNAIEEFKPDIVHAHYASSYGMLGWLAGFHPFILSVWGSDVLDFPNGFVKKKVMDRILRSADSVLATSQTLKTAVQKLSGRDAVVTPFGVDTTDFAYRVLVRNFRDDVVVYSVVKSLEKIYNVDVAIKAFALLHRDHPDSGMLITGDGTERSNLEALVKQLGIESSVVFAGKMGHAGIPAQLNRSDVFLNLSQYESFGVSVLEAMACAKPVIVTNTGGLAEIVSEGVDGLLVPVGDVDATVVAMKKLHNSASLRKELGGNGRKKVVSSYAFERTIEQMESIYSQMGGKR